MATLKYMAKRDPNINVKMTAAELLIHVGMQTLPEQIWLQLLQTAKTHISTNIHTAATHV